MRIMKLVDAQIAKMGPQMQVILCFLAYLNKMYVLSIIRKYAEATEIRTFSILMTILVFCDGGIFFLPFSERNIGRYSENGRKRAISKRNDAAFDS